MINLLARRRPSPSITILDSSVGSGIDSEVVPPPPLLPNMTSLRPVGSYESRQPPAIPSFAPLRLPIPAMKPASVKRLKVLGVVSFAAILAGVGILAPSLPSHGQPTMHVVSGKAGVKTTSTGAHEKWSATKPVTIVLDGSLDDVGPGARAAVRDAFGTWATSGAGMPALTIDNQTASGRAERDGVNRILVAPITIAGHEKDVAVTIGYADDRTGAIVEADMIFNSKYRFAALTAATSDDDETAKDKSGESDCKKRYDLQNVATHEAGHFFGLGEDMDDTKATMYLRSATCETHKRALTETDKEAMGGLYPAKAGLADQNGAVPGGGDEADANGVKAGCGARVAPVSSPRTDASFALLAVALAAVGRRFRVVKALRPLKARGALRADPARPRAAR